MDIIEINKICCKDNCCDKNSVNINDHCELFQNLKNNCCKPFSELKTNCCILFEKLNYKENIKNINCKSNDDCCNNKNNIRISNDCCKLFNELKEIDELEKSKIIIEANKKNNKNNKIKVNSINKRFTFHHLQQFAIGISVLSIFYNGAEGAISIVVGNENRSNSLIFFGIQSFVEVISACLVVWRFSKVALPGNEKNNISIDLLNKERKVTIGIGILFGILTIGTWVTSIISLIKHSRPDSSTPSLIISASALGLMILIWLPKPWLAKSLNSSAMHGEAKCSLACIYITTILLIGTIIYRFWEGGWWVDSSIAIILGLFFAKDCFEMISWGLSSKFNGGCCKTCSDDINKESEYEFNTEGNRCNKMENNNKDICCKNGTCTENV